MDNRYLFRILVKGYYDDKFEDTVNSLLIGNTEDKQTMKNTISALCGIEVDCNEEDFIHKLKKAILTYNSNQKIVIKTKPCTVNCLISNEKTQCQNTCAFDAILRDKDRHTTFIDNSRCIDCGFCIEACPNNNYMDKVEYIPLINLL
jgi:ferredoxin hydrogenase